MAGVVMDDGGVWWTDDEKKGVLVWGSDRERKLGA